MNDFLYKGDSKTPTIRLSSENGEMEISGKSIPENSVEFFKPVHEWIDRYLDDPKDKTIFKMKLEYFNTSSSKSLIEIFRKFEELFRAGKEVLIEWYYEQEDEDMYESGEDFRDILKVPVELIVC